MGNANQHRHESNQQSAQSEFLLRGESSYSNTSFEDARGALRYMAKDITDAVKEICLWFPEAEEVISRGSPDYRVAGKTFATYVINHHGDGHLALWLRSPPGAQSLYVDAEPDYFYVPPYVGPKGWMGVDLDQGLSWLRIADMVGEAYVEVAPKALTAILEPTIEIAWRNARF